MKTKKSALIQISLLFSLLFGFIISFPLSIVVFIPLLKKLGSEPNILIVLFVVLPALILIAIICAYICLSLCLLLWKPMLTKTEIDEYIYKQILFRKGLVVRKKDIRWIKKNMLKKPWYLVMAALIFIAFILDQVYRKIITAIFPQINDKK